MIRRPFVAMLVCVAGIVGCSCYGNSQANGIETDTIPDSLTNNLDRAMLARDTLADGMVAVAVDSLIPLPDKDNRYTHLTEEDFRRVANELQVEVAAIKAVVEIEAGKAMQGFWAPGVPVINFDQSMWSSCRKKVTSNAKAPASATIPAGLTGAHAKRAWQRLINARKKNIQQANLSTFWGMFQIGGFNYKLCGCSTIEEFVELMSYSELEQLELFAAMITNCKFVQYLRTKDWAAFARRYNGPSYSKRGYHTRMAAAYRRFKAQEGK